jgi:hypothetical protein
VADAQRLAGLAVQLGAVARAVIGHQPLDADAVRGEPRHGALQERGDRLFALVVEHLDVGQAGAVIDADVDELPADSARARRAIAVDAMAGAADAPKLLDVDVDQFAGHRTLVTVGRLGLLKRRQLGQAQAGDHAAHGALGHPQHLGDRHRAHPDLAAARR